MKVIFDKQLPQMKPILSSIKKDLHEIMTIIEEIENQIELIELGQKLQITLFNKQKLITSHEEIQNINKINQAIKQVTKDLQELITNTPFKKSSAIKKNFYYYNPNEYKVQLCQTIPPFSQRLVQYLNPLF